MGVRQMSFAEMTPEANESDALTVTENTGPDRNAYTWKATPFPWIKSPVGNVEEWGARIDVQVQEATAPPCPRIGDFVRIIPKNGPPRTKRICQFKEVAGAFVARTEKPHMSGGVGKPSAKNAPYVPPVKKRMEAIEHVSDEQGIAIEGNMTEIKALKIRVAELEELVAAMLGDEE